MPTNPAVPLQRDPMTAESLDIRRRSLALMRDVTLRPELRSAMDRAGLRERRNQLLRTDGRRGIEIVAQELIELRACGGTRAEAETMLGFLREIIEDLHADTVPDLVAAELAEVEADIHEDRLHGLGGPARGERRGRGSVSAVHRLCEFGGDSGVAVHAGGGSLEVADAQGGQMSDETKVITPEQARLLVRAVRSRHSEGHPEYGAMYCGLCADCWPCSAEDAAAAVESLAAQVERFQQRAALMGESDQERLERARASRLQGASAFALARALEDDVRRRQLGLHRRRIA